MRKLCNVFVSTIVLIFQFKIGHFFQNFFRKYFNIREYNEKFATAQTPSQKMNKSKRKILKIKF